jgi:cyclopropane fatty-acyl-phospholipid synthase-like methyltransferase
MNGRAPPRALPLDESAHVIDIGSGLGGPSRYLAETYGCTVRGIDLSQSFVDAANFLAERSEGRARLIQVVCEKPATV